MREQENTLANRGGSKGSEAKSEGKQRWHYLAVKKYQHY